jgi:hypothetical protein
MGEAPGLLLFAMRAPLAALLRRRKVGAWNKGAAGQPPLL